MRKIYLKEQIQELKKYPKEVINNISEIIDILDENYGLYRNIESDLGGYIIIVENMEDLKILKQQRLQSLIAEYTDVIECKEGVNWTSSLFLLSSDYSIVVVCTEELYKYLIER